MVGESPEAEFLVEKPGTKTGLLPAFYVFSSRHLLSGNAWYFWLFASFSSRFLQFVSFSSCFEEGTRVSLSSRFVKSGYCFQVSDSEKVTTSSKKKTVTTFSRDQKSCLRCNRTMAIIRLPRILVATEEIHQCCYDEITALAVFQIPFRAFFSRLLETGNWKLEG